MHHNQSYQYDQALRLQTQLYPSGYSQNYSYDNLSRLNGLSGLTTGNFSYDSQTGALRAYTLANGVQVNRNYDQSQRLSELLYTNSASELLKSYDFGYDNANNITSKQLNGNSYPNRYSYDSQNRLTNTLEFGRFDVENRERQRMATRNQYQQVGRIAEEHYSAAGTSISAPGRDILGGKALTSFADSLPTGQPLDINATSIGVDLGDKYQLKRLELNLGTESSRINPDTLAVYLSDTNAIGSYTYVQPAAYQYEREGSIVILRFTETLQARFVKVHCSLDERDYYSLPVNKAEVYQPTLFVYYSDDTRQDSYNYDPNGNRIRMTASYGGYQETSDYQYWPNSDRLKSDGYYGYFYDANGNLTEKGRLDTSRADFAILHEEGSYRRYSFDHKNRLERVEGYNNETGSMVELARYTYDYRNYRVRSVKDGKAVHYVYDDAGSLVSRISEEENADFVYLGGQLLARISDGKVLYYLNDHLGTTTMAVDASGMVVWSEELGVFGNITGKGEFADDYAYYTGKEYEAETGLYYFNARWYDAELGRFISEDPIKDGLNWYAYCSNNPLVFTDPTGLEEANLVDSIGTPLAHYKDIFGVTPSKTVFTSTNPIQQKDFDKLYGFPNKGPTVSCQTNSLINQYAASGGISRLSLDRAVRTWKAEGSIAPDGSPLSFNNMSLALAREGNRKDYFSFIYPDPQKTTLEMSNEEFKLSEYTAGIQTRNRTEDGITFTHYTAVVKTETKTDVIDSFPAARPNAKLYSVSFVMPLQLLNVKQSME